MLKPESESELRGIVAEASGPLRVMGGGTRPLGAPVEGEKLTTSDIQGIELHEPDALTMVARAGTAVADIEKALSMERQRLAFEPIDHRRLLGTSGTPTIGGVFAANASGPRRIQCGAARDFLLGVKFVDGRGNLIRNGGRVMKNVTGYDLVKLMTGSYGTLGIMTEVSFKVMPMSRAAGTLLFRNLSDADAINALSKALGSPFEITGAAHVQKEVGGFQKTLVRVEGTEKSIRYRCEKLCGELAEFGSCELLFDQDQVTKIWQDIRDVAAFENRDGDVWRISVKPTDAPGIVAGLNDAEAIYDWGGGLVWILLSDKTGINDLRRSVIAAGGHATLVRGDATRGAFQSAPAAVAAIEEGLRGKFDPRGILNPGLMRRTA